MGAIGFEPTSLLRETGLQPAEPPTAQHTQKCMDKKLKVEVFYAC